MNLYDTLGIKKDATPEEIKAAYRKRAQSTHPDRKGGDMVVFQKINKAYSILSKRHLRKRYDETGHTDMPPDVETDQDMEFVKKIGDMLFQLLDNPNVNMDTHHLIDSMKRIIQDTKRGRQQQIQNLNRLILLRKKAIKRIIRKDKTKRNPIKIFLEGSISQLEQRKGQLEYEIKDDEDCLVFLNDFDQLPIDEGFI
jgi:DnaJ-class molecular chaperone